MTVVRHVSLLVRLRDIDRDGFIDIIFGSAAPREIADKLISDWRFEPAAKDVTNTRAGIILVELWASCLYDRNTIH